MKYFIADTHFNHENIIRYCNGIKILIRGNHDYKREEQREQMLEMLKKCFL